MSPNFYTYLTQLSLNNNRPWFQEHKAEFDDLRSRWLDEFGRLIEACA